MKNPTRVALATASASLCLGTIAAHAADMSAGSTAPTVDGEDFANYAAVSGTDKWWNDAPTSGRPKGQTFTTGIAALRLNALTYQVSPDPNHEAMPTKTYVIRVGTVSGTTFTEVHSETATQTFNWNSGEYMTWTLNTPQLLNPNTTYGIDVGMTTSTSSWQTGIPYLNRTADEFAGGSRYMSGTTGLGIGDSTMNNVSGDMVFHIDLETPIGPGFEFLAASPADNEMEALASGRLIATFSQNLAAGSGDITIRNLSDSSDLDIAVGDPRISLSDNLLVIDLLNPLLWSKDYAIRIEPGALKDDSGNDFAGIISDATWNFTTAAGDPLLDAIDELKMHIEGDVSLSAAQIEAHKLTIDVEKGRFDESASTIAKIFDLVTTYEGEDGPGPLWIARGQFDRDNLIGTTDPVGDQLDWTIYQVMQYIIDEVYNTPTLTSYEGDLNGYKFASSANFPGSLALPDPTETHTVPVNGSFPDTFGRDTQQWTLPARKPTGCYLAPGTIATVTVPPSLVGQGYKVRVGAHSWDLSHRRWVRRLDRSTTLYNLDSTTTKVANPLGGGIYIEVPMHANAGVVNVTVTGAARAPYFSAKSFHQTTPTEWLAERSHSAPWADFQSDKFMMQVPTNWIYNHPDPAQLMQDWDAAMDAINDLMGFPHVRGKETMYPQVDVLMRSSVHAPGYPAVNVTDNPNNDNYGGYRNHYLVRGPGASPTASHIEFHEQGHAYFFPKFGGETESNVNLLQPAMLHRKFGYSLDVAQRASLGSGNTNRTLDNTAVAWMCVFNFSPREVPMASGEKAYQHKGHAKFMDIARLYGWEGLDAYWRSFMEDDANSIPYSTGTDDLLLRLCQGVGEDIRPLFHFWGIFPENPATLATAVAAEGLTPPVEIYDLLVHYKSLVPADNTAFRDFAEDWWNKQPSINGYWEEREHARQWDTEELFGEGDQQRPNGEMYVEASAADIQGRVQELIDLYYPDGRPLDDYETWETMFPGSDLTDPDADLDKDGLSNNEERIWGLNPTVGSPSNPFPIPPDPGAGTFSYTRRDDALTGLNYSVWTSPDLQPDSWTEDTGAVQDAGDPDINGVETVTVTLTPTLLDDTRLFVRIRAAD